MATFSVGGRKLKRLNFIRSDSGSFKGARLHTKIRKTVSLPNSPLNEDYTAPGADSHVAGGNSALAAGNHGGPKRSPRGEPHTAVASGDARDIKRPSTISNTSEVFEVGQLSSRGVSFLMDTPAVLSKSRTEKFHKLFKSVPQHEYPIDYFSCAYIGDILLQGNLYVSQNWFCFYSRIRGRGRLLEIPMDSVISITREKTALIFPNAIGLQTKKEKFAFGSFISRDNTYKFIVSVWKKSQELKAAQAYDNADDRDGARHSRGSVPDTSDTGPPDPDKDLTDGEAQDLSQELSENLENNNISSLSHSNSKTESTDQSDISVCLECGSVDPSDTNECKSKDASEEPSEIGASPGTGPQRPVSCDTTPHIGAHGGGQGHPSGRDKRVNHKRRKLNMAAGGLQFPYSVLPCIDRRKTLTALRTSAVKLQRIPRTNLLLAVCTILVLFLLMSSVGLTYKILDLEAKMASQGLWSAGHRNKFRDQTLGNIFYLQTAVRDSAAQHVQNILQANMKILDEINTNMKSLYQDTKPDSTRTCEKSETTEC